MRYLTIAILLVGGTPIAACGESATTHHVDWSQWRSLPVQSGGRHKPLDTLARESLRMIGNQSRVKDPETGETLDATAFWLKALFDWQGWDSSQRLNLSLVTNWRREYFRLNAPDKWDRSPLLRVDYLELRKQVGVAPDVAYVSAAQLAAAKIEDPRTEEKIPFAAWAEKILELDTAGKPLTPLEKKALELADRYWAYLSFRMGRTIEVLPVQGSEMQDWMPLATLMIGTFDDGSDPTGGLRQAQQHLNQARVAYRANDAGAFEDATRNLSVALRELGAKQGTYPTAGEVALEIAYNHWAPFRIAWIVMLLAFLCMLLHLGSGWTIFYRSALAFYSGATMAVLSGLIMRMIIARRPPVTNMYESIIYVGSGVALFGLLFFILYRNKYLLAAAAAVATVAWVLADNCPTIFDPSVRPLEPVLRSNFWLVIHVMTITLSYAAFALALGVANVTLGYLAVRSLNRSAIAALNRFTYKAIQVGVLLLAAGVILGGVWADYSWGRFWGWDPKEVWALVALLGYLAVLHARFAGWVGQRGLAALAVACFALIIVAWYGVNFVLGVGLHSYGFGGGGLAYVLGGVAVQMLYVVAALWRSRANFTPSHSPDLVAVLRRQQLPQGAP